MCRRLSSRVCLFGLILCMSWHLYCQFMSFLAHSQFAGNFALGVSKRGKGKWNIKRNWPRHRHILIIWQTAENVPSFYLGIYGFTFFNFVSLASGINLKYSLRVCLTILGGVTERQFYGWFGFSLLFVSLFVCFITLFFYAAAEENQKSSRSGLNFIVRNFMVSKKDKAAGEYLWTTTAQMKLNIE